ncbi:hypothetical protein ACLF3G_23815 [Falsiroseomonas sp. HC035]|uniref:hypothetical protein n=1 Tax=Falsiroseomonas sp. HC035 TaxID=3390999 RepID=UPI003D323B4B
MPVSAIALMAELKPMLMAFSRSPRARRSAAVASGISRDISRPMIAGIIWKVEALPMPVRVNNTRKLAKKPMKAPGSCFAPRKWTARSVPSTMPTTTRKVTRPATGNPAGHRPSQRADQWPEECERPHVQIWLPCAATCRSPAMAPNTLMETANCKALTPRLPSPAFGASEFPFCRFGKKKAMVHVPVRLGRAEAEILHEMLDLAAAWMRSVTAGTRRAPFPAHSAQSLPQ